MELLSKIKKTFPNIALFTLSIELESILNDCESVLDLGCGKRSPLGLIKRKKHTVGVDLFEESIKESKKNKIHNKYFVMNILDACNKFGKNSFDAVIAMDVIEHLNKKNGMKLIKTMEEIARKKVVILTPNGFINQKSIDDNSFQEHLSGWEIKDFKKMKYTVLGKYGLKSLRKEEAALRWRPKFFWGIVSELSHFFYTKKHPQNAFSLLCYKNIKKKKNAK